MANALAAWAAQPLRTVQDYQDADAERQQRGMRNALLQMQMQQAQQGMADQQAVRNALSQHGATEQGANALMQLGAFDQAQAVQKQLAARQQAEAAQRQKLALRSLMPAQGIDANRVSGVAGPRPEALGVVGQRGRFDPAQMLAAGFAPGDVEKMQGMIDPRTEVKDYQQVRMPDGSVKVVGLTKDGKTVETGQTPFIKPEARDFGGYVGGIDPVTGRVQNYGSKTMSAAELAVDARAREKNRNDAGANSKLDWKQDTAGNWVGLPKDGPAGGQVQPVTVDMPGKRQMQSQGALDIIKEAEGLIDKATGSGMGAMLDSGAQFFGKSTEGAQYAAKLKGLEGALMMAQPRMEGPQSNMDVALYRQMAGQIGDPTVPAETKRAAIAAVKQLHEKYAGPTVRQGGQPAGQGGRSVVRTGTMGGRKVIQYSDGSVEYAQ
jgi:hypothetical protein